MYDNVIVALQTIPQGTDVMLEDGRVVTASVEVPAGHKMVIQDIPAGGEVIKYSHRIGNAKEDIKIGDWIHTHNVKTALGDLLKYTYDLTPVEEIKTEEAAGFQDMAIFKQGVTL